MNFEDILSRLDGVKRTGSDRATAFCPGHGDKNQSLSLREAEDGKVLIHCFAGCRPADVVNALGLELSDLFPQGAKSNFKSRPNHWHAAREALKTLSLEVAIVVLAADVVSKNRKLTAIDRKRLLDAVVRIREAYELCR